MLIYFFCVSHFLLSEESYPMISPIQINGFNKSNVKEMFRRQKKDSFMKVGIVVLSVKDYIVWTFLCLSNKANMY